MDVSLRFSLEISPGRWDGSHRSGQIEAYGEWVKLGRVRISAGSRVVMLEKGVTNMSETRLREHLERLREQVNDLGAGKPESIERLNRLITDIESQLENRGDQTRHEDLIANVQGAIRHFEVEHPRATAILNDIMVALSNIGI